ncbi:MAG: hypothetical protein WCK86_02060, partial [Planctomycetia bacterium]
YLQAFSRYPRASEMQTAVEYLTAAQTDAAGAPIDSPQPSPESLQDLIWALMNTREFMFNH